MIFAHDTEESLVSTAALVNSVANDALGRPDTLATTAQLTAFLDDHGFTGTRTRDGAELDAVRALRDPLRRLWQADRDDAADLINQMLRDGDALPQLVRHDGWDWHLHATEPTAALATRLQVEAALAFVDVIRTDEHERLRTCEADDCDGVLIDLSRNRSRRFCATGNCGNRMNVTAYRARKAAGG